MQFNRFMKYAFCGFLLMLTMHVKAQNMTPVQIVGKAYDNQNGANSAMSISMKVIRPNWSREMTFTSWSKGRDLGMMQINAPAKDKGVSFLKIKSEGWNWLPSIERAVKISPAQMTQSWMGSDFTNEDVLREASIINDYTHTILGEENFAGVTCYKIEAKPKADAAVVWGKVMLWISKNDLLQRKAEYFDEDNTLYNELIYKDIKEMGGKKIATTWEMIPANKPGQKSIVTINSANFKVKMDDSFFTQQNLKKAK
jgi:outer membrane lipoprotein-sorting protein